MTYVTLDDAYRHCSRKYVFPRRCVPTGNRRAGVRNIRHDHLHRPRGGRSASCWRGHGVRLSEEDAVLRAIVGRRGGDRRR